MRKTIFLLLLSFSAISHGQVLLQKSYGEFSIHKMIQTTDSGLVLLSVLQSDDVLLIKTNAGGDTLWTRIIGNNNNYVDFHIVAADSGGCAILFSGFANLLLVKMNGAGDVSWDKTFVLPVDPSQYIGLGARASMVYTYDGGYFVSASQSELGILIANYGLLLNSVGDTLWTHEYGAVYNDFVVQTSDSGFVIGGSEQPSPFMVYNNKYSKTDPSGNPVWAWTSNAFNRTKMAALKKTHDGGIIMAGGYLGPVVNGPLSITIGIMIKTNSMGDTLWTMAYDTVVFTPSPSGAHNVERFTDVAETQDGGFITCSKDLIVKTDSLGIPMWTNRYAFGNYSTTIEKLLLAYDGGIVLSGQKSDSIGYSTAFVSKIDGSGNSSCQGTPYIPPLSQQAFTFSAYTFYNGNFNLADTTLTYSVYPSDSLVVLNNFCSPTGIGPGIYLEDEEFTVYPNPAGNSINLNAERDLQGDILITDMLGKALYIKRAVKFPLQIQLSAFPAGVYNLRFMNSEGILNWKLILSR